MSLQFAALTFVMVLAHACSSRTVRRDDAGAGASAGAAGAGATNGSSSGGEAGSSGGGPTTGGSAGDAPVGSGGEEPVGSGGSGPGTGGAAGQGANEAGGAGASDTGCEPSQVCAPPRPSGWSGPAAVASDSGAPTCPRDFPTLAFDAGRDVAASSACTCECGELTGTCPATVEVRRFASDDCSGSPSSTGDNTVLMDACFTKDSASLSFRAKPPAAQCDAGSVAAALGEPSFEGEVRGCIGGVSEGACLADGQCFELPDAPFSAAVCIFRSGEHDCPAGYPARSLVYESWADDRTCPTECDCEPEGGECRVPVALRQSGCMGGFNSFASVSSAATPQCLLSNLDANTQAITVGGPSALAPDSGQCLGEALTHAGDVAGADPVTLCCLE